MLQISTDTEAVLNYLDSMSGGLRKKNDMGMLLELAAQADAAETINQCSLMGKMVWNTYNALRKRNSGDEGYALLEQQFSESVHGLRTQLFEFFSQGDPAFFQRVEETYLGMTQGTLRNVVDLAHDLAELKNLQNEMKRNGAQNVAGDDQE
jgi:hypothetical protein